MFVDLLCFLAGLIVGWFFLPSPLWAKNGMTYLTNRFGGPSTGTTTPTSTTSPMPYGTVTPVSTEPVSGGTVTPTTSRIDRTTPGGGF